MNPIGVQINDSTYYLTTFINNDYQVGTLYEDGVNTYKLVKAVVVLEEGAVDILVWKKL